MKGRSGRPACGTDRTFVAAEPKAASSNKVSTGYARGTVPSAPPQATALSAAARSAVAMNTVKLTENTATSVENAIHP